MGASKTQPGFRRSNSWIHTWSSLPFIWLLYAVFLTGTLSFFRAEIGYWLQPELHQAEVTSSEVSLQYALDYLQAKAPDAAQWRIDLPDDRTPELSLRWFEQGERPSRFGGQSRHLDPSSGEELTPRESRFADFLYRFHFDLYAMPRDLARWIVGIASLGMLIALITGIIIHKKIFIDFFTLRLNKGQRSWMDLHNACSVLILPFHLMITLSGLFLLMYLYMPWGVTAAFDGDFRAYRDSLGGRAGPTVEEVLPASAALQGGTLTQQIQRLHTDAQQRWTSGVASIQIQRPYSAAEIELRERSGASILNQGRGERLRYDSRAAELSIERSADINPTQATYNVFASLHQLLFAGPQQRWIYFIAGLIGTLMVASGAVLWIVKRARKPGSESHKGMNGVRHLNLSTLIGLPLAITAGLWANRLLPVELADRQLWEIRAFFIVWLLCFLHPFFRTHRRAWQEQCLMTALLLVALPVYNLTLGASGLPAALAHKNWLLVSMDLLLIVFAIGFLLIDRILAKHWPKPAPAKNRDKQQTPAQVLPTGEHA